MVKIWSHPTETTNKKWLFQFQVDNEILPGDSSRDLFIPNRWRSLNLWKGHLTIPKRSQRIARYLIFVGTCDRLGLWNSKKNSSIRTFFEWKMDHLKKVQSGNLT